MMLTEKKHNTPMTGLINRLYVAIQRHRINFQIANLSFSIK